MNKVDELPAAIKVGIRIGSVCQTRLVTGVCNYSLSCLLDCSNELAYPGLQDVQLILDGGIKHIGDIAKALIAGADITMLLEWYVLAFLFHNCGDLIWGKNPAGQ